MKASISILACACAAITQAQPPPATVDTVAIMILDHMADNIGGLHAVNFHLRTTQDVMDHGLKVPVKQIAEHDVYMVGPDKMLVDTRGDKGHTGYWYDGTGVAYYSYTENNYGYMPAPANIIETIDSLHRGYGVDFPAADLFHPTFVDDLIAQSGRVAYRGKSTVEGRECFHIVATGKTHDMQLWIANDATFRPVMYVIREKAKDGAMEHLGIFSDWRINPDLPDAMFRFMPPPGANKLRILSRHE